MLNKFADSCEKNKWDFIIAVVATTLPPTGIAAKVRQPVRFFFYCT